MTIGIRFLDPRVIGDGASCSFKENALLSTQKFHY